MRQWWWWWWGGRGKRHPSWLREPRGSTGLAHPKCAQSKQGEDKMDADGKKIDVRYDHNRALNGFASQVSQVSVKLMEGG